MILSRLEVDAFRNLEGSSEFSSTLNIFYGDNAQGKTNWLEAIYILGTTKSFRTSQLRECIKFDAGKCLITGTAERGAISKRLQVLISDSSKELYANSKRETISRYLGNLTVFALSLEGLDVIRGDASYRRRFIDRGVVALTPSYLERLSEYNRVVKQKNRLLATAQESAGPDRFHSQIEAWNERLAVLATDIHAARSSYVEMVAKRLEDEDHGRRLFEAESVSVRYRSSLEGKGDLSRYSELLRERLALRITAEIGAGHCLIGPHRDDVELLADGRDVARFGSAGQQRSALFLLVLAQISIYTSAYEERPVLLIDDIDAELDRSRIEALISELEFRAQTFVSTSRRAIASRYQDRACVLLVERGQIVESNANGLQPGAQEPLDGQDDDEAPELE